MLSSFPVRLCVLIILSTGCTESSGPTAPPPTLPPISPPGLPPAVNPTPAFPTLSRPGEIFRGSDELYDVFLASNGSHIATRYVLYDSTAFGLQFSSYYQGFFEYTGHYFTAASGALTFTFDLEPRWQATGILQGDSLTISYNDWAMLSDFIGGVYVRSPGQ
jgi:hypothetical protein